MILAIANTLGLLPSLSFAPAPFVSGRSSEPLSLRLDVLCTSLANLLLAMDMAAIGLEVNVRQLVAVGGQALTAGLLSTAAVGAASLVLILLLF
jgi:uncharacterized membrane protein YadS